jgi:hypothetical protein
MKGQEWVWRTPPEMVLYLKGDKDSQYQPERVLELVRLLRQLLIVGFWQSKDEVFSRDLKSLYGAEASHLFSHVLYQFGTSVYSEWLSRIISAAVICNTGFCDDLAEAFRYIHRHDLLDPKGCLSVAYLELTRPENYQPVNPLQADAFLHCCGGLTDTQSVQRYAEILHAALRAKRAPEPSAQLELFTQDPKLKVNWSELFKQLGLTKEYLPRAKGGRPRNK